VKIGLNGQHLLIEKLAGPEVYTFNTFRSFAKIDQANEYIVYFDRQPSEKLWQELSLGNPNFSYKVVFSPLSWTHVALAKQLFKDRVDVFFNAVHTIPLFRPPKTVFVSMVHGLEYKVNRNLKKFSFKYLVHPLILWRVMRFSKLVIVPSVSVKKAISNLSWPFIDQEKVRVVPEGVNDTYYKRGREEIDKIREKYKIGAGRYLFFVSTIQPRKNIPRMVHGFSLALEENKDLRDAKLLISGKLGWMYQDSLDAPKKYGVQDNVMFLGRTPDVDLPILYSGAEYFINLSLEEGFGIPLLEAMACETPAIVSDIPAFRELGREFPIYVDPYSIYSIRDGIKKALTKKRPAEDIKKAREISQKYTWENTAEQLLTLFQSLVKHL